MTSSNKRISIVLGLLQVFIGIGAIPPALMMILDPSGASVRMPADDWLAGSPFTTFLIPGIFLFTVNGLGSLIGAAMTFKRHPSASLIAMALGILLMAWIIVQVITLGLPLQWLQPLYFLLGAAEFVLGWRMDAGAVRRLRGLG